MEEEKKDIQNENPNSIETARGLVDEMKAENDRRESLLKQEETLHTERILSGRAEAGHVVEKKEETAKEYGERILAGK